RGAADGGVARAVAVAAAGPAVDHRRAAAGEPAAWGGICRIRRLGAGRAAGAGRPRGAGGRKVPAQLRGGEPGVAGDAAAGRRAGGAGAVPEMAGPGVEEDVGGVAVTASPRRGRISRPPPHRPPAGAWL